MVIHDKPANVFEAGCIGTSPMNFLEGVLKEENDRLYVDLETFRIYVPEGRFKTAKMYVDKEVIIGIRPEDIGDYDFMPDANPENVVVVDVDVSELIGAEIYLHVSNGPHSFTARVDAHTKATDAEEHRLVINNQKIHLFDKETEKIIP